MADKPTPVRSLTSEEVMIVCAALDLKVKSDERYAKSSENPVIASEYSKQASRARNLITHFRNSSLDI